MTSSIERLRPYVPRLVVSWLREDPHATHRSVEGSLAFVDISGFTSLTERLARRGKVGAEEMNDLLSDRFSRLLEVAYRDGAGLVKWGGDAVLLLFEGTGHAARACHAAYRMRRTLRDMGRIRTSVGFVTLRMSIGVHSGSFDFFLVGTSHRELLVTGPDATHTVAMEATATAGQILISEATAASLDPSAVGASVGQGRLLRACPEVVAAPADPAPDVDGIDIASTLPVRVRKHLLAGPPDAEHRQCAVAFVEFRDVDELLRRSGPGVVATALEQLITDVEQAAEQHGVTFLETDISADGGKILLLAGAPTGSGADDDGMLLTARAIADSPQVLSVRIGVNSGRIFVADFGPAFRRTYSIKGDAVNLAARVMGKAALGQVLVTEETLRRTTIPFETEALDAFTVKGKKQPVLAHALGAPGRRIIAERAGTPLVGRERELEAMLRALDRAVRRHGSVVDLVGEPGIGKSRLVDEVTSRAGALTVLFASCEMYEASTPYHPFRALLRDLLGIAGQTDEGVVAERLRHRIEVNAPHLVPWLPLLGVAMDVPLPPTTETEALADEFRREKLAEVVVEFLAWILPVPTLMVFDDVHWMDDASSALLHRLISRAPSEPWLVCVTRRDAPAGFRTVAEDPDVLRISLEPLDEAHTAELVARATEETPLPQHEMAGLVERSGGNPLFLRELIRAAHEGAVEALPETVEDLIMSQIDRLPPADRRVLRYASVLGPSFDPGLVGEMVAWEGGHVDRETWERLDGFVSGDASTLRFRHALIRDAAYEGLPYRRRRDLHGRVGSLLEERAEDPREQAELLSLHFYNAQRFDRAWTYSRVAATRAQDKFAMVEAAELYRRAIDAARAIDVGDDDLVAVHAALGDVYDRLGLFQAANVEYRNARRSARGRPVVEAGLLLKQSWIPERFGNYGQALRWLTKGYRVLEGVDGIDAARQRAQLAVWSAAIRHSQGRYREAVRSCERAIEEGEASGELDAIAHASFLMDLAFVELGEVGRATHSTRALEIYEQRGDLAKQAAVLNNLGMFAYFEGRWAEAVELYERGSELRLRVGDTIAAALGTVNIGEVRSDQGALEDAEALFRSVLRVWIAAGYREMVGITTSDLGRVASRSRRFREAHELFDTAEQEFAAIGNRGELLEARSRIAECLVFEGRSDEAIATVTDALTLAEGVGGVPPCMPTLYRSLGSALAQDGRMEPARDALARSLDVARRRNADYDVALTLTSMRGLADALGEPFPDAAERERCEILERLEVRSVPEIPLAARAA